MRTCRCAQHESHAPYKSHRPDKPDQSSLKRALISSSNSSMAFSASGPSQRIRNFDPCPAASIIRPMILLPFTSSPSFETQISERYRLAMRTNMAAGPHWNSYMRHFKRQDLVKFPVQSYAVDLVHFLPFLKCNDEVEALFNSNTANSKNFRYINNTDATHFHVIAGKFRGSGHELAPLKHCDPGDVVSYQAVATFDQSKHTLAFSNAAGAAN